MKMDQLETGPIAAITVYSGQVWRAWKVPRNALEDISLRRRAGNMSVPGDLMGLGRCDFRMFEPSLKDSFVTRFVRVILLNVQASFWVAIVLAVAALYEATEVIAMMGQG